MCWLPEINYQNILGKSLRCDFAEVDKLIQIYFKRSSFGIFMLVKSQIEILTRMVAKASLYKRDELLCNQIGGIISPNTLTKFEGASTDWVRHNKS